MPSYHQRPGREESKCLLIVEDAGPECGTVVAFQWLLLHGSLYFTPVAAQSTHSWPMF